MSSAKPPEHRHCDLSTRDEIGEYVTRFYREIAQDDRFRQWFEAIAHIDWHAHTTELTDFWAGLDGPRRRADEVIGADQWRRETDALDGALFERWLELFDGTLDAAGAARSPRPLVSGFVGGVDAKASCEHGVIGSNGETVGDLAGVQRRESADREDLEAGEAEGLFTDAPSTSSGGTPTSTRLERWIR